MIKAAFSASLLQSSVSHNPSEIILKCWFASQETFLIIVNVENRYAVSYIVETVDTFIFSGFFDKYKFLKGFIPWYNIIYIYYIYMCVCTYTHLHLPSLCFLFIKQILHKHHTTSSRCSQVSEVVNIQTLAAVLSGLQRWSIRLSLLFSCFKGKGSDI